MRACGRLFKPKLPESGNPLWIGWRVAGGTGRPSSFATLSDRASGSNSPRIFSPFRFRTPISLLRWLSRRTRWLRTGRLTWMSSSSPIHDSSSIRWTGIKTPKIPHFHSMSEAKRSECVGLSACVKHGHVVPSKYCTWLRFDYVRPSILTRTLVAYSLHDELPNCQCHFSSLSFAHALWPLVCCIHFSSC